LHTTPRHTRTPSNILHGLNHRSWRSRQGGAVPDQEEKASHQKLTKEEKGRQARTRSRRGRAGKPEASYHQQQATVAVHNLITAQLQASGINLASISLHVPDSSK
jgi:hypothetical protein